MLFRDVTLLVVFLLSGGIVLQAQIPNVPILPGEMPLRETKKDAVQRHELRTGVRISGDYDDNALSDGQVNQANLLAVIEPRIGWTLANSRVEWTLDYRPGFIMSPGLSIYDSRSHFLDTSAHFMLSKRFELRMRDSFLKSNNVFDRFREFDLGRSSSTLDRPNISVVNTPQMQNEQAAADLIYALDAHSIASVAGAFYSVSYSSPGTTQQSTNAASVNGHVAYSHHFTRRRWAGLAYNIQDLTAQTSQSRSLLQSLFYTDTIAFRRNMTFSIFVGPEHSASVESVAASSPSGTTSPSRTSWHWAGGSSYSWSGAQTSVAASYSRTISDGGGLQGIVHVSSLMAEVQHRFRHQWKAEFVVSYAHDTPLSTSAGLSYASAGIGVTRALTPRCSLEVRYWRVHELSYGGDLRSYLADHNRISTSLSYDFKRPLWSPQR